MKRQHDGVPLRGLAFSHLFVHLLYNFINAMLDKPHVQQIRPLVTGSTEWWDAYNRGSSLAQHKDNKQKQSCRASVKERIKKTLQKPPLLSLFLTKARSIVNKNG